MLTQLNIIQDQSGYTVSTTHQTHAGALAHFTELLADFTREHHHAAMRAAQAAAATDETPPTAAPDLPHRWEGLGHNGQPIEAPATTPYLVATTAKADERAAPAPAPLFRFGAPGSAT